MSCPVLFWDVDTQHDFMDEDGKLPAPGAQKIVANLARVTQFAVEHRIPIVATADAHPIGDPEFVQFGEHCVPGTHGQKKIEETSPAGAEVVRPETSAQQTRRLRGHEIPQLIVEKQVLDAFDEPLADKVLAEVRPEKVLVYGVATEYCVRCETLSLRQRGYEVTVITDAIKPIKEEDGRKALAEMRAAGVKTGDTETVLRLLAGKTRRK